MARKRYSNTDPNAKVSSWKEVRKWQKERKGKIKDLSQRIGQAEHKQHELLLSKHMDTTITWIGHSTFLLQMGGLTIVTDPVWANRMGFERRLEAPGLTLDEIPSVDVILLSHAHYDHLHIGSLRKLRGSPVILVPEGLGPKIRRLRIGTVIELNWWEKTSVSALEFHFVPAQHWNRRTLTDTNSSLWGGWVIRWTEAVSANVEQAAEEKVSGSEVGIAEDGAIYFAGDSGYFKGFQEIGTRFPDIQYALLPIGAYEPEWFMGLQHVTPEEAVQAFLDVGAKTFIPMHYGAFRLADDTPQEALERLLAEWERRELGGSRLRLLKHGETLLHGSVSIE